MSFTCLQLVLFQREHLLITSVSSIGKFGRSSTLSEDFTGCPTIMEWDRMGDRNHNNNTAYSSRLDKEQVMHTLIVQMIGSFEKTHNIFSLYGSNWLDMHRCTCTPAHTHTHMHTNLYVQVNMYSLTWSRGMDCIFHMSSRSLFNTVFCYRLAPIFGRKSRSIMVLGHRFRTVLVLNQRIFFSTNVTWPVLGRNTQQVRYNCVARGVGR